MSQCEIELRHLLNRKVVDADGEVVGRLEELRAEVAPEDPSTFVVSEFHLGAYALLEALAGGAFGRAIARLLWRHGYRRYVVGWELMDLSDPCRPRLRKRKRELPDPQLHSGSQGSH